jgi:hypothetical protein
MIIDHRVYTFKPDKLLRWMDAWQRVALPIQKELLGEFLGMFTTEVGPLNEVIHLWAYESMADREQRRARMLADPRWQAYLVSLAELAPYVQTSNRIIRPTAFSPRLCVKTDP